MKNLAPPPGALNRRTPIPLYHQMHELLARVILRGEWRANQRLPTEDDLAVFYEVSKITVRQAISCLVRDGLVRREQGRGTFVTEPKLKHEPRQLTSFSQELAPVGETASSRVLECELTGPSREIAAKLGVSEHETFFFLKRLRFADGRPLALQSSWIPATLVRGIERVNFGNASLNRILADEFGLIPEHAVEVNRAVNLTAEQAALLEARRGLACFWTERVTYLPDGRTVELVESITRGDSYEIRLELVRRT